MADGTRARLTASQARRFAGTVGVALVAVALFAMWRGHRTPGIIGAALAIALAAAGLIAPLALDRVYRGWMRGALAISKVTTPILLGVVYFLAFVPMGIAMRLVGRRPLSHGASNATTVWISRPAATRRSDLTRQF
jgi:hypothetical protein